MDSLRQLEEVFAHFPGIGPRQARRFVQYLLNKSPSFTKDFIRLVEDVKKATSECEACHRMFYGSKSDICSICFDSLRDQKILMIVAHDSDMEAVERSASYRGLYFILGGTVSILNEKPEDYIRLKQLLTRISKLIDLKEIILSLNATPEGENTASIVRDTLNGKGFNITLLGRGLSTGSELEYADSETIRSALNNRN